MEHIAAFMLLIACSEDLQACREYPAPAVAYETVEQCRAEMTPALRELTGSTSRSFGKCVDIDPALFYEDVEIAWDVTQEGLLEVSLDVINPHMAIQSVAGAQYPEPSNPGSTSKVN